MHHSLPNFKEEQAAKIPALTLLTNLGYEFVSPEQCNVTRTTIYLIRVLIRLFMS